jgi:hypothetical protein
LEDGEIERQLKGEICDVGLYFFGCFEKYHTKARFSYVMLRVKPVMYIKQITTKKACTFNYNRFKNK